MPRPPQIKSLYHTDRNSGTRSREFKTPPSSPSHPHSHLSRKEITQVLNKPQKFEIHTRDWFMDDDRFEDWIVADRVLISGIPGPVLCGEEEERAMKEKKGKKEKKNGDVGDLGKDGDGDGNVDVDGEDEDEDEAGKTNADADKEVKRWSITLVGKSKYKNPKGRRRGEGEGQKKNGTRFIHIEPFTKKELHDKLSPYSIQSVPITIKIIEKPYAHDEKTLTETMFECPITVPHRTIFRGSAQNINEITLRTVLDLIKSQKLNRFRTSNANDGSGPGYLSWVKLMLRAMIEHNWFGPVTGLDEEVQDQIGGGPGPGIFTDLDLDDVELEVGKNANISGEPGRNWGNVSKCVRDVWDKLDGFRDGDVLEGGYVIRDGPLIRF